MHGSFPLEDKKGIAITNTSQKIIDKSGLKRSKIWVAKDTEFAIDP